MRYEWDPDTTAGDVRKQRVGFEETITVFLDPCAITFDDPDRAIEERRFLTLGNSARGRILFVSHAERGEDGIRIIGARRATRTEAHAYQERRT